METEYRKFYSLLLQSDPDGALAEAKRLIRKDLAAVVFFLEWYTVHHVWWMAGEVFDVKGRLGVGPWWVVLSEGEARGLNRFYRLVETLASIPPKKDVQLFGEKRLPGMTRVERGLVTYLNNKIERLGVKEVFDMMYDRIAGHERTEYELGAGRIFRSALKKNERSYAEEYQALMAITMIFTRGLKRRDVISRCYVNRERTRIFRCLRAGAINCTKGESK